ncbi:OLC1v1014686C1 [Oldenlandia corymbosa var. corymbosa]|uniref:gibberellin 3beta-dioxygenase n=1 Tax=Oldenlandia corymbosa var. corymbosa TaxID=529605 RepID=A0AAV1E429_OLDCO|nr:OLC1v1014686C1 [Oldenlandia corymbosa var. corymbosa]
MTLMASQVPGDQKYIKPYPVYSHPKQLDLSSVQELPESHAWASSSLEDDFCSQVETVPVIDLSDVNVSELLGNACRSWGVFQVKNHGFPKSLLQEMESLSQKLFSLPMQQKLKAARSIDGFSGYGVAPISSFFPKVMWSEGFTIIGSPLEHARRLWPQDHSTFCDVIEEFEKEMKKLAMNLMWLIFGSLGIKEGDIEWAGPKDGNHNPEGGSAAIQLNSYPACPEPDRAMGLAAHTDSTILTILHQNNTSGLQVHREGTGWVTVPPLPGALVVNAGDLLQILSNGLFPSVLHRAVVNRTRHRFSIAYLYGPPSGVTISPVPKLLDQSHPPLYRPVTWKEYLGVKSKIFDKALNSLRLCSLSPDKTDEELNNDHNLFRIR